MKHIQVALADRSYPIYIGENTWQPELLKQVIRGKKALIITNETIAPLYLDALLSQLSGVSVDTLVLPDGERFKTLQTLTKIYDHLMASHHDRATTLIALGGGVIGDITGFAAATYQRGVDFIQVPTTLLAQVDSSVGGKTAVNHPLGKNMIGAFYQPKAVFIGTQVLQTLPAREFSAGLAEVIKYGLIRDADFLSWLENNMQALIAREPAALAYAIQISCQTKADVVASDETEQGVRAILNLGHTFGHAIEAKQAFKGLLHGEAVAVGMALAAKMSCELGFVSSEEVARVEAILVAAGLPITMPAECEPEEIRELMSHDKKVRDGQLKLVLLERIGFAVVTSDYPEPVLEKVLRIACA